MLIKVDVYKVDGELKNAYQYDCDKTTLGEGERFANYLRVMADMIELHNKEEICKLNPSS